MKHIVISISLLVLSGCTTDKAKPFLAECLKAEMADDMNKAMSACKAAVTADPLSESGKQALARLSTPKYSEWETKQKSNKVVKKMDVKNTTAVPLKEKTKVAINEMDKYEALGVARAQKEFNSGELPCNKLACASLCLAGGSEYCIDGKYMSKEETIHILVDASYDKKNAIKNATEAVAHNQTAWKLCGCAPMTKAEIVAALTAP